METIYNLNTLKIERSDFSLSAWRKRCGDAKPYLYIIMAYSVSEGFIKVGRTCSSIQKRFENLPYPYKIIFVSIDTPTKIFNLENLLHRELKKRALSYTPSISFSGMTECYKLESINYLSQKLGFHHDIKNF